MSAAGVHPAVCAPDSERVHGWRAGVCKTYCVNMPPMNQVCSGPCEYGFSISLWPLLSMGVARSLRSAALAAAA